MSEKVFPRYMATNDLLNKWMALNNTKLEDITEDSRFSRSLLTTAAVLTVLIMVVGVLGNLLTIVALLRCPKVRNVAAAFIISLCVADFVFCLVVLPFAISRYSSGTWNHGNALCMAIPFMRYGNIGVSLLSIALITVNRYIMIAHHGLYARVYKRTYIAAMIAFSWLFSYGMQVPTLLGIWGRFGYDDKLGTCSINNDRWGRSSKTALFVIAFLVPCVIIIICYARIFWVVHSSENRMRAHSKAAQAAQAASALQHHQNSPPTSSGGAPAAPGSSASGARELKARRNEWRITKMVLAIFLSFLVCYLPITIVKVTDTEVHYPALHIMSYMLLYLSACINPIIYVIMNKQYRQAYKAVLLCKSPRLLFTPAPSSKGEKSKEQLGYSYNHSRTMVSQVSLAPQPGAGSAPGRANGAF